MTASRQPESDREARPDPAALRDPALQKRIAEIGRALLEHARSTGADVFSRAYWTERLMDWSTRDEAFKYQLFRFIDAFPALITPQQVHAHLADYLLRPGVKLPFGLGAALRAGGLLPSTTNRIIAGQMRSMAARFIAGADTRHALPVLGRLWRHDIAHTITLLGEKCLSEREALAYQEAYRRVLREVAGAAATWPASSRAEHDQLGTIPRINLSLKLSALHPAPNPAATDTIVPALQETIRPILDEAKRLGAQIHFDNEHHELKDLIFDLFMRCAEVTDIPIGVVVQAYLRSAEDDAQRLIDWTRRTGRQVTIRLVKGAYWDSEIARAERMGWPHPVWSRKSDTDACFERVAQMFVAATPRSDGEGGTKLALGSHNARSIAAVLALIERHDLPPAAIELQMLYGMAGELKTAAAALGYRVREYVPVGEMIPGMAYLVRRLLENTSNESWLKASFKDHASPEALLASPHQPSVISDPERPAPAVRDSQREPLRDFADRSVREAFAAAIHRAPPREFQAEGIEVGDADEAIAVLQAALPDWSTLPARPRAAVLIEAASIMQRRRDEIAGAMIRHAGMCWRQADAEVCRAIEFCVHHAQWAVQVMESRPDSVRPRRVCMIAPPHGEPLAGLCAPAAAALVTGNTVLIAPDAATRAIARIFAAIMDHAGCPREALRVLADDAARVLRERPELEWTGEVPRPGSAIIVDESADLDSAVLGARRAAFAFSGQAPHACKRAIVLQSVYDAFLTRLCESTATLKIGDPFDPSIDIGPVIDHEAHEAASACIAAAMEEAHLALTLELPDEAALMPGRHYVAPHIFANVPTTAHLAHEWCPGPILTVVPAASFEEALRIAVAGDPTAALGLYSRTPSNIDRARADSSAPLLFINRPIESPPVGRRSMESASLVDAQRADLDCLRRFFDPSIVDHDTHHHDPLVVDD